MGLNFLTFQLLFFVKLEYLFIVRWLFEIEWAFDVRFILANIIRWPLIP